MYYDIMQCLSGLIAFCVGSTPAFLLYFTVKCMFWETVGINLSVVCRWLVGSLLADCRLRGAVLLDYHFVCYDP